MRQILWFRRDLRISDSAILAHAKDEVLPIFIFDTNILSSLPKDDKRVSFLYKSVLKLKENLQSIGLDLAIFHGNPLHVISKLKDEFDEVLCSVDFDSYARKRDEQMAKIIPLKRYLDAFILDPSAHLKKDGTPYKVFTPFYKSLDILTTANKIVCFGSNKKLKKVAFAYEQYPSLQELGFRLQELPSFLEKEKKELFLDFTCKLDGYEEGRDFFHKDATSKLSVHLRFGLISPREVFNYFRGMKKSEFFIRELFWREFYNYTLFHFPYSEEENFNKMQIPWNTNRDDFQKWCDGMSGIPIIDAAMRHLNSTGLMHNRLRMVVSSFLTKNLFIDWRWGEAYFAKKLLDYEASSNVGSWQWAASTGVDAAPYFRVFNPYTQSKKFDKDGIFIKSVIKEFEGVESKLLHVENAVQSNLFIDYPQPMVNIKLSRQQAIEKFKEAKDATS